MNKIQCEYCGQAFSSVQAMTANRCYRHPMGPNKGPHKPYEGSEKSRYTCKYCGQQFPSIQYMTSNRCFRHPNGSNRGPHAPML